jgi:hypothetical protein
MDDPTIGYSDSVGIPTQIFNNTGSILKRWLAVNNPFLGIKRREQLLKFLVISEMLLTAMELSLRLKV